MGVNCVKPSSSLRMKPVHVLRSLNKLASLNARLLLFLEKLRRARLFLMELAALSANFKETLLMPKRQLESSIHTMQAEVDGMLLAAKNAEEKSKKAMVD